MNVVIFAGSKIYDCEYIKEHLNSDDYYVACDGGLDIIDSLNITPNVIIGDLDSVNPDTIKKYKDTKILEYPPEKDLTDLDITINYCENLNIKYDEILIFGATNGRADHYIANVFLIEKYYNKGVIIKLIDENNILFVTDKNISVTKLKKYLSLIPLTNSVIVSIKGVKYELENKTVSKFDENLMMVSNEIINNTCTIDIFEGKVLVIQSN